MARVFVIDTMSPDITQEALVSALEFCSDPQVTKLLANGANVWYVLRQLLKSHLHRFLLLDFTIISWCSGLHTLTLLYFVFPVAARCSVSSAFDGIIFGTLSAPILYSCDSDTKWIRDTNQIGPLKSPSS